MLAGLDALEPPEIVGLDVQGVRVPASQSFRDPRVVESLSVAELEVTGRCADGRAQEHMREGHEDAFALRIVPLAEGSSIHGHAQTRSAAQDL